MRTTQQNMKVEGHRQPDNQQQNFGTWLLRSASLICLISAATYDASGVRAQAVQLPEITVDGGGDAQASGPISNPDGEPVANGTPGAIDTTTAPSADAKAAELATRPGGQAVISAEKLTEGKTSNEEDVFRRVPGVFVVARDNAPGRNFISIRGSDIAERAGRRGRGVLSLIDGVPVGRTGAGSTSALVDTHVLDYVEVYRGGNALQFGAGVSGGVVNYVPKKGSTFAPGKPMAAAVSSEIGSFGYLFGQTEIGGEIGNSDYYVQWNGFEFDSFRQHNDSTANRLSANYGVKLTRDLDTRFYVSYDRFRSEAAGSIPLNKLEELYKTANIDNQLFDYDINYRTWRLANKTNWLVNPNLSLQGGVFFSHTSFDHLPVKFTGFSDNLWVGGGAFLNMKAIIDTPEFPQEIKAGVRLSGSRDELRRFQHKNGGQAHGTKVGDWDNKTETIEAFFEDAVGITESLKLFAGVSAIYAHRETHDNITEAIAGDSGFGRGSSGIAQPGSLAGIQQYDETFRGASPKIGMTYHFMPEALIYANASKSYEVPSDADLSDVVTFNASNGANLALPEAQSAWTYEIGTRGKIGNKVSWDLAVYHMDIDKEILTFCDTNIDPTCNTTPAFNADKTVHRGVELGLGVMLSEAIFDAEDHLNVDVTYNHNDFYFDGDSRFGDNDLPLVPSNTLFTELTYYHPTGFYLGGNITYLDERNVTYDGSGGTNYVVPSVTTFGAKLGYKSDVIDFFVEGKNLSDEIYVSTFNALPTVPLTRGRRPTPVESPSVRPASPLSVNAGLKIKF